MIENSVPENLPLPSLAALGWSNFYVAAHANPQFEGTRPVRVMAVHRAALDVLGQDYSGRIPLMNFAPREEDRPTVGDWIAIDPQTHRVAALYPRKSLFKRRNPGKANRIQLIAANVDTVFIVTSANMDFNVARLERYLALAVEAGVIPVVVITKADMIDDAGPFVDAARDLRRDLVVELVDARSRRALAPLLGWAGLGQTVALMGSSGVGKSTLVNSFIGNQIQGTQGIREDDARGRHTTSARSIHRIGEGGWLIDTPGMREIQVVDAGEGIDGVFEDIASLALNCRFSNCQHTTEPGCAVQAAIDTGALPPERLERFQKLQREERHNTEQLHEAHARDRSFGKMVKRAMSDKAKRARNW
jgi:ribosome biogenesis GTPase / thiamine phosphate phosphatase